MAFVDINWIGKVNVALSWIRSQPRAGGVWARRVVVPWSVPSSRIFVNRNGRSFNLRVSSSCYREDQHSKIIEIHSEQQQFIILIFIVLSIANVKFSTFLIVPFLNPLWHVLSLHNFSLKLRVLNSLILPIAFRTYFILK